MSKCRRGLHVAISAWTSLISVIYLDGLKQIVKPTLIDVYPSNNFTPQKQHIISQWRAARW